MVQSELFITSIELNFIELLISSIAEQKTTTKIDIQQHF